MSQTVSEQARFAFYAAALAGLHVLERRERRPRRFGPEADARWQGFRGHLSLADRLDLLVRDAAVTWKSGFAPAQVFALPGLASDEPFGPDWQGLSEVRTRQLWLDTSDTGALEACARALGIEARSVDVPELAPSTRLVLAGGSAILTIARTFQSRPDLSWYDQVLVAAERPAHKQLGGLVAPILGTQGPTRWIAIPCDNGPAALQKVGFSGGAHAVVSSDATEHERAFARGLASRG